MCVGGGGGGGKGVASVWVGGAEVVEVGGGGSLCVGGWSRGSRGV